MCVCLDSQSDSSKSMKLERQPSNLIDSFAQTETHTDTLMLNVDNAATAMTIGCTSSDMVDSGVGSQHKSSSSCSQHKELANPSTATAMDEDEDISFTDDRLRYKNVSEEEIDEAEGGQDEKNAENKATADDDEKKDDEAS